MVADHSNDLQRYLESVGTAYKDWWSLYTLTDAVGKQQVGREKSSSVVDFGLMVQRMKAEQPERGEAQDKTERLPVLEGLQKYASAHVLLVGRPGSGKSTALARLLLEEAEKSSQFLSQNTVGVHGGAPLGKINLHTPIPVLVELRQYKTSVLDLIREFLIRHRLRLDSREIETLLFERRFLLLIDGLNELPSEEARRDLKAFRLNHAATSMIFTTRELGVGGDLGIEKKLEMQPLTEAQMQEFVRAYLPEQGDLMLRPLRNRLREMGQTPLLLWMLCELFRLTGNIPPNLGFVFRCFAQSYDRKIKEDVPVSEEFRRWLPELLQHLALVMMQGKPPTELRVTISQREAEAELTEFLQGKVDYPPSRAKEWLEDLLEHHLIQLDSSHQIEFRHQLLQEYYAAESLLRQLLQISDDRLKRDYLNYLKWTETLALMLALVDDEAEAIRVVKLALAVDLQLGARLAGEVQPTFQEKTVGLVIALDIPQLLKVEFLGITRSGCSIATLRHAFYDEDSAVRWVAAVALGKLELGTSEAVEVLIPALSDNKSNVPVIAASVLGRLGTPEAVAALIGALKHEDPGVRGMALSSLGKLGTTEAVAALIGALKHKDSFERGMAAKALGLGTTEAVAALIGALRHEDSFVRGMAASALGELGTTEAVAALIGALRHEDSGVRGRVAEALGKVGTPEAVAVLIPALNDQDSGVRRRVAEALGKVGTPEAVAVLIPALNDQDSGVRGRVAEALGKVGTPEAVAVLIPALNDQDSGVRGRVAEALGKVGTPEAVAVLIPALNDQDSNVRVMAASALGELGTTEAVAALIEALRHEDSGVRRRVAEALGKLELGTTEAVAMLIGALRHKESAVGGRVDSALGKLGTTEAVEALIGALNDEDSNVRVMAASALGKLGTTEAVEALIGALNDEDSNVRVMAASALGKLELGTTEAVEALIEALIEALNDEDFNVSESVAWALGQIVSSELLTRMWELRLTTARNYTDEIISKIQARCRFYNHEIFHSPLPEEKPNIDPLSHTLDKLTQTLETMSQPPTKYDFRNSKIGNFADTVQSGGRLQAIQHNYASEQKQNLAEVAEEIQQLLDQLEQVNQTATEAQLIVNQAVERQPLLQDSQVVEQAIKNTPSLKVRLRSAGKAAYLETVKVLLPAVGVAIEAIKAWKEPEE
jgi:HEAT repeat protein